MFRNWRNSTRRGVKKHSTIAKKWRNNGDRIIPFFEYPEDIRSIMYTTNAIGSVNRSIRKGIKAKGSFPHYKAILKLLYLALNNASKKWTMPIKKWENALNHFAISSKGGSQSEIHPFTQQYEQLRYKSRVSRLFVLSSLHLRYLLQQ